MIELLASHDPATVALLDASAQLEITYGRLIDEVGRTAARLRSEIGRGLVFQLAANTVSSVALYLACLEAGCPVCLMEPGPIERIGPSLAAYGPDAILAPSTFTPPGAAEGAEIAGGDYRLTLYGGASTTRPLNPNLALLLPTSGSTGSAKLVRLTSANLLANARSIVSYLEIAPGDRAAQSLPMHYSFGLSLINSHLLAGASVALTPYSFLQREFWEGFDRAGCTAFAGVPYIYETLHRLRFEPRRHPSLRTMTQAGGGLRPDLIRVFYEKARASQSRFFVMYGQTEATARISYVPWERLGEKIGSIGIAIPGGRLWLAPSCEGDAAELVYSGPNVMLGYAESAADLALGDMLGGVLRTGDTATADSDGFFTLTGRLKRFAKLFGRRINLEDIEHDLERRYPLAAIALECDGRLRIFAELRQEVDLQALARDLAIQLIVPPRAISAETIAAIPLTASGKKDYRALES